MTIDKIPSRQLPELITPISGAFYEAPAAAACRAAFWTVLPKALAPVAPPTFLLQTPTHSYSLSRAQAHGFFGIFRLGVDTRRGQALGVKQLHYHDDHIEGVPPVPGTVVHSQRRSTIIDELELQTRAGALKPAAVVEVGQQIFVVMALMHGDLLALSAALRPDERSAVVWSIFAQVAAHLSTCHEAGYVHRDVKLANVLWNQHGSVTLADYGLAAQSDDTAALSRIRGTAFSQPPEALAGDAASEKLDVWLLAVTLWHLLVPGHQPFKKGFEPNPAESNDEKYAREKDYARSRMPGFIQARAAYLDGRPVTDPTWAPYFREAHDNDPVAFAYIMRSMFDPNPATRMSADQAGAFALKALHALPPTDKQRCREAFARIGRTSQKRAGATLNTLAPAKRSGQAAPK